MIFAQIHPILVPFAVAMLITGVVFEFYGRFQNEESARTAGGFNLRLGLAFAGVAMAVGFLGVIGIADLFSETDPRLSPEVRPRMRHVLLSPRLSVGLCAVMATGYCGGELVHRFGLPSPVQ